MENAVLAGNQVRFGVFEVDLRAGELRKNGIKLKLSGQPFQVLTILLARPGAIVTREELQKQVWPHTFVDAEHNLNTAINKIREVLGDSADNPRFVETIPRRGYRFIAEIKQEPRSVEGRPSSAISPANWRKPFISIATLGMAGLAILIAGVYRHRPPSLRPPRVLRYTQLTNDALPKVILNFPWEIQLLTNGPRIYFPLVASGLDSRALGEIPSSGTADGSTSSIRASFEWPILTGISPDGSQLLAAGGLLTQWDRPLWVVSLPSGTSRRLGALEGHDASWSPDGRTIVFAKNHELYRTDTDGSTPVKLASLAGDVATFIRWSPDGTRLRFTVTDNVANPTSSSLWQISSSGADLHRLFPASEDFHPQECCGGWSSDGKYFVFQATRGGITGIWAAREEPRSSPASRPLPFQLTAGPIRFTNPLPSKDGKRIFAIGEQLRGELTRFDLKSQKFVPYLAGISAEQLNFSRDGQWVTYVTYPESVLWRSRVDGNQRQQLTVPPLQVAMPRWSPNGQQIAFQGNMPGEKPHLYVISSEGGSPEPITTSSPAQPAAANPTWSPDGNSVIFFEASELGLRTARILLLDLHTRQVSPLPASEGLYSPRWSPDGRHVVAITSDFQKLLLFDFPAQKWSELATGSGIGWNEWSSDGKYVFYMDHGQWAYSRVDINEHKVERIANLEQARGSIAGRFWSYYGVAPDGSPLFLRNTGIQEIYGLDVDLP